MQENTNNAEQTVGSAQIKSLFYQCLAKWYWFVISVGIVLICAVFYLLKTTPVYTRSAKLLVKSDSKGHSTADIGDFSDLGLVGSSVKINNELITIQSLDVMSEVVRRLHLEMNYQQDGLFRPVVLYDKTLPVTATIVDTPENLSASFDLELDKGTVTLTNFVQGENKSSGKVKARLGDTVSTPIGLICVNKTDYYKDKKYETIHVRRGSINGTARSYSSRVKVGLVGKNTDVLSLSVEDINKSRGDDILNMLVAVYNGNWLKDKNQITVSTSMFINDRLQVIEQELGNVDSDISSYKSENLLPDVGAVSNMYLSQNREAYTRINELNNQISITRYVRNYLTNETDNNQLLPVNTGINNGHIESQISTYNTMMLRRNGLVANSSEQNPLVLDLDEKLKAMRHAILTSIDNQLATLNTQLANFQGTERMINARLAANPKQANYLLSVERQQKVKESLYLFLLQKREENELSQAFTAYNTRMIEHPNGSNAPTKPRKSMILLAALIVGIAIPIVIIVLKEYLNTTVRGRKDLEKLTMPFVGEIPLSISAEEEKKKLREKRRMFLRSKRKGKEPEQQQGFGGVIVVKHGNRNAINEAFRVLRTNIEFMTKGNDSNVIMLTSFNPGSGKSFITMNTALTLAIKNRKVLLVDGDLRHASLSAYIFSPKRGLANFLGGQEKDVHDIIVKSDEYPTLSYLPVGTIPPNPTELLETELFGETINMLRKEYDYVFIDCPPIDIVADPQIISNYVDRTIFVVRVGLLERSMLPELEELHTSHKYNNLCLILNGSTGSDGRYGYSHYGHYGYKYGYRYGYGHNYYGHSYYHKEDDEQ
ncbi:MAG: polysaccharide biosynthesis tyrosine autokinase [Bacteroidales bacterium]|nr:polysaccharide biosynthesis tyrosine autokinase [Bacteroidales bacterium]